MRVSICVSCLAPRYAQDREGTALKCPLRVRGYFLTSALRWGRGVLFRAIRHPQHEEEKLHDYQLEAVWPSQEAQGLG